MFGTAFTNSGFSLTTSALAPGAYDIAVFPHRTITGSFGQPQVVRIIVQWRGGRLPQSTTAQRVTF